MGDVFVTDDPNKPMSCGPYTLDPTPPESGFKYDYHFHELSVVTEGAFLTSSSLPALIVAEIFLHQENFGLKMSLQAKRRAGLSNLAPVTYYTSKQGLYSSIAHRKGWKVMTASLRTLVTSVNHSISRAGFYVHQREINTYQYQWPCVASQYKYIRIWSLGQHVKFLKVCMI